MNDYLMHSMMRSSIENKIGRASAQMTSSVAHMSHAMQTGMVKIRTDMLEGFGSLRDSVEHVSTRLDEGVHQLNLRATNTQRAVQALGMSVDLMSENMIAGFSAILERVDRIENEIAIIKKGVLNPSETLALERSRVARSLAERGAPKEALAYVDGAIFPPDGLPMRHILPLRMLRGALLSGVYDTEHEGVVDPKAARAELTDALRYADVQSRPLVQDHLGAVVFGMQDYQGAYAIYEEMAATKGKIGAAAELNQARCLLMIGRKETAMDLIRSALTRDRNLAIQIATDPVCEDHHAAISEIVSQMRDKAFRTLESILSAANKATNASEVVRSAHSLFEETLKSQTGDMGIPVSVVPLIRSFPKMSVCGKAKIAYVAHEKSYRTSYDLLKMATNKNRAVVDRIQKLPYAPLDLLPARQDWEWMQTASIRARDLLIDQMRIYEDHVLPYAKSVAQDTSNEGVLSKFSLTLEAEATLNPDAVEALREKRPTGLLAFRQKAEYDQSEGKREILLSNRMRDEQHRISAIASEILSEARALIEIESRAFKEESHGLALNNVDTARATLDVLKDAVREIQDFIKTYDLRPEVEPRTSKRATFVPSP